MMVGIYRYGNFRFSLRTCPSRGHFLLVKNSNFRGASLFEHSYFSVNFALSYANGDPLWALFVARFVPYDGESLLLGSNCYLQE